MINKIRANDRSERCGIYDFLLALDSNLTYLIYAESMGDLHTRQLLSPQVKFLAFTGAMTVS